MGERTQPSFDLDALRALPVSLLAVMAGTASLVTLTIGFAADARDLLGWSIGGAAVAAVACVQLARRRPDPALLSVFAATAFAAAAPFSSHDPIAVIGAAIIALSIVAISLFTPSPMRAAAYLAWTGLMTGITFWVHHPGWTVVIGLAILLSVLYAAWTILRAGTQTLERAERRYRTLFEHGSDALLAVDTDRRVSLVNAEACRAFGYDHEDLIGKPLDRLIPDGRVVDRLAHLAATGHPAARVEVDGIRRTGQLFPAEVGATTIEVNGDRYVMVTVRDVTSRVEAEGLLREREQVYRDLFDGVPVGLYRTSTDGVILDANPALATMLGFDDPSELIGVMAGQFYVDADERPRIQRILHGADGRTQAIEMQLRRRTGDVIWVRDHVRVVTDAAGKVTCYEGAMQDITEEKRAFAELELEIRSKTELIAAVSHELRTPLTAVVGFIDVLLSGEHVGDAERRELLALAGEQATDLALLVEDLLTAAHIEQNELIITPGETSLNECVSLAIETLRPKQLGPIHNEVPEGLSGWCDPVRVRQIIRNLVGNGLVHGSAPVTVSAARVPHGMVELAVTDCGQGIPEHLTERVFESFFRGDRASTPGSIGLGLAVSRRLARLMGGDLEYRGVPGASRFVLTLPGRRPANEPPRPRPSAVTARPIG